LVNLCWHRIIFQRPQFTLGSPWCLLSNYDVAWNILTVLKTPCSVHLPFPPPPNTDNWSFSYRSFHFPNWNIVGILQHTTFHMDFLS
jgi:hypothetical protein